jgi:outer membrane protein TolC
MKRHLPIVAAVLAAAACTVAWHAPAVAAERVVTLDEASSRAIATHERIRAAQAAQERAEVAPWRAVSAMAPSVKDRVGYTREKEQIAFPSEIAAALPGFNPVVVAQDEVRNVLAIGQPLYVHQFWALREIGKAEVKQSDEVYRAARQDVLLSVAAAYYELLRAQALEEVARKTLGQSDVEIEHASERVRAGEAVQSDVLRAQTEKARAEQRLAETLGQVDIAHDQLRRLAALEGEFTVTEPALLPMKLDAVDGFLQSAHERNPDLKIREAAVAAAVGEEHRREAQLYPSLGVDFAYQNINHDTFADRNDFWSLVVRAQIPIFESGGSHWLDVSEQRAVVSQKEAETSGFSRDLDVDVRRAWITVRTLEAKRIAADEALRLAGESYRMLSEQYTAGVATNLDVLTALTSLALARADDASIRYASGFARIQLARVAGTLDEVTP